MESEPLPRAYTEEEIQARFLDEVRAAVNYWASSNVPPEQGLRERLEGLAFSFLVLLDGNSSSFPACMVMAAPHPTDRQFHIDEGENYYPEDVNIAGNLHEKFYSR